MRSHGGILCWKDIHTQIGTICGFSPHHPSFRCQKSSNTGRLINKSRGVGAAAREKAHRERGGGEGTHGPPLSHGRILSCVPVAIGPLTPPHAFVRNTKLFAQKQMRLTGVILWVRRPHCLAGPIWIRDRTKMIKGQTIPMKENYKKRGRGKKMKDLWRERNPQANEKNPVLCNAVVSVCNPRSCGLWLDFTMSLFWLFWWLSVSPLLVRHFLCPVLSLAVLGCGFQRRVVEIWMSQPLVGSTGWILYIQVSVQYEIEYIELTCVCQTVGDMLGWVYTKGV